MYKQAHLLLQTAQCTHQSSTSSMDFSSPAVLLVSVTTHEQMVTFENPDDIVGVDTAWN